MKNVKSVVVPNTGGLRGIGAAAAGGVVAGVAEKELQVIAAVSPQQQEEIREYLERSPIHVGLADTDQIFYIEVIAYHGEEQARVAISGYHTNVICKERNGQVIFQKDEQTADKETPYDQKALLSVEGILDFAETVDLDDVRSMIQRQIDCNWAIAQEGLRGNYGANIGSVLLKSQGEELRVKVKAYAAAGSDARMNGCEMPVVIVSGSGNQGITASVPVITYAREKKIPEDRMMRAVVLSDLVTIHQKSGIGRLSAYCGAISAGCGAGAAIAYLDGGDYDAIAQTIVNAVAITSGVVCDGAKASCAAKIATAVEAGLLGCRMYQNGQGFCSGDGIVGGDVEQTIRNVGRLAREGMRGTDKEIIQIMLG